MGTAPANRSGNSQESREYAAATDIFIARSTETSYYTFGHMLNNRGVSIPVGSELLQVFSADDAEACVAQLAEIYEPWKVDDQWYDLPGGQAALLRSYQRYVDGRLCLDMEQVQEKWAELSPEEIQPHPKIKEMLAKSRDSPVRDGIE